MKSRKKLIVGNWKMNPRSLTEAKKSFVTFKRLRHSTVGVTTVICPPFVFLSELRKSYSGSAIFFGAQDVAWQKEGAFTGEVSTAMLQSIGCHFVIVGHSERRAMGESNELVSSKVKAALKSEMHTIVCVGESERDMQGKYLHFIENQIHESLAGVSRQLAEKLIVAYEPLWAIGNGNSAMSPNEVHQMSLFIHKILVKLYGRKSAEKISILYGGSVDDENAKSIVYDGNVDGLLVGRQSLNPYEFSKIINVISKKK